MSFLDSVTSALRKFSPKPPLEGIKANIEPVKLPSEQALSSYESRYDNNQNRPPVDTIREPQIPVENQFPPAPLQMPRPRPSSYPPQTTQAPNPKIDLILAEIETVKAQMKVLSEKLDILESHYKN